MVDCYENAPVVIPAEAGIQRPFHPPLRPLQAAMVDCLVIVSLVIGHCLGFRVSARCGLGGPEVLGWTRLGPGLEFRFGRLFG